MRQYFSGRSDLFGCTRSKPSQGSVPDLTLAGDFSFGFRCKVGSSSALHRPIEITALIVHVGPGTHGRKNYGRNHSRLHLLPCGADSFDNSSIFGLTAQVFEGRVTREIQQVVLTLIERCLQVLKGVLLFA